MQIDAKEFYPSVNIPIIPIIPEAISVTDIGQMFLNQAAIPMAKAQEHSPKSPKYEERKNTASKSCIFKVDNQSPNSSNSDNNMNNRGNLDNKNNINQMSSISVN